MKIRIWKPGEKGNPSGRHYYYQFFLRQKRYRGILDARNAEQAKQAAQKIWDDEWNRKYDPEPPPPPVQVRFADFVKDTYLPWSKIHKGSYEDDIRITSLLADFFKGRTLAEIKPAMIEQFKAHRIGAGRAPATVNRELSVLSKVFTLAVRHEVSRNKSLSGR